MKKVTCNRMKFWGVQCGWYCARSWYTLQADTSSAKSVMLHSEKPASCVASFSGLRQSFLKRSKVLESRRPVCCVLKVCFVFGRTLLHVYWYRTGIALRIEWVLQNWKIEKLPFSTFQKKVSKHNRQVPQAPLQRRAKFCGASFSVSNEHKLHQFWKSRF